VYYSGCFGLRSEFIEGALLGDTTFALAITTDKCQGWRLASFLKLFPIVLNLDKQTRNSDKKGAWKLR